MIARPSTKSDDTAIGLGLMRNHLSPAQGAIRTVMRRRELGSSSEERTVPSIMRTSRCASETEGRTSRNSVESCERDLIEQRGRVSTSTSRAGHTTFGSRTNGSFSIEAPTSDLPSQSSTRSLPWKPSRWPKRLWRRTDAMPLASFASCRRAILWTVGARRRKLTQLP